jgi:hypothetical protein
LVQNHDLLFYDLLKQKFIENVNSIIIVYFTIIITTDFKEILNLFLLNLLESPTADLLSHSPKLPYLKVNLAIKKLVGRGLVHLH